MQGSRTHKRDSRAWAMASPHTPCSFSSLNSEGTPETDVDNAQTLCRPPAQRPTSACTTSGRLLVFRPPPAHAPRLLGFHVPGSSPRPSQFLSCFGSQRRSVGGGGRRRVLVRQVRQERGQLQITNRVLPHPSRMATPMRTLDNRPCRESQSLLAILPDAPFSCLNGSSCLHCQRARRQGVQEQVFRLRFPQVHPGRARRFQRSRQGRALKPSLSSNFDRQLSSRPRSADVPIAIATRRATLRRLSREEGLKKDRSDFHFHGLERERLRRRFVVPVRVCVEDVNGWRCGDTYIGRSSRQLRLLPSAWNVTGCITTNAPRGTWGKIKGSQRRLSQDGLIRCEQTTGTHRAGGDGFGHCASGPGVFEAGLWQF